MNGPKTFLCFLLATILMALSAKQARAENLTYERTAAEYHISPPLNNTSFYTLSEASYNNDDKDILKHKRKRSVFIDLGYQLTNIEVLSLGLGFVFSDFFINFEYGYGNAAYSSRFFDDPEKTYDFTFHSAFAGIGYDIGLYRTANFGLYLGPAVQAGIELTSNDNHINNPDVEMLMNYAVKPVLTFGLYYKKLDIYIGANYYYWLSSAMNEDRHGLYNLENEQAINWSADLFQDREGVNIKVGLRLNF